MAQTIGFVGFGNVNSVLAKFAVAAGYQFIVSNSRGPSSLSTAVAELGPSARAATVEDAVRECDFVSVSIPLGKLEQLPAESFDGKVVIDTMNYYPERDGHIDELDSRQCTTSARVQRYLKGSVVVKAFHNIDSYHLLCGPRPANSPERWALPLAGDNTEAKALVASFISAIGFDPVDCGSLADSWRIQQHTPVYCSPYVGPIPEGKSADDLLKWVQQDHSPCACRESSELGPYRTAIC